MNSAIIFMMVFFGATNTAEIRPFPNGEACERSRRPLEQSHPQGGTMSTACTGLIRNGGRAGGGTVISINVSGVKVAEITGFGGGDACNSARLTVETMFPAQGRPITTTCGR